MGYVWINRKRLIPAPFIAVSKDVNFAGDGRPLNSNHNITLRGTLLPNQGSPQSVGWYTGGGDPAGEAFFTNDERFNSLLAKQELIREEFSKSSLELIYHPTGSLQMIAYPKLRSISFEPDTWVIRTNYEINLEAARINRSGTLDDDTFGSEVSGLFLTAANDSWSVNEREDGTGSFDVTRTLTATANTAYYATGMQTSGNIYGVEAWKNAKRWVDWRLANVGITYGESNLGIPATGSFYNLVRTENIDRYGGNYSLSLRYLFSSGNYTETRQVSRTYEYNTIGNGAPAAIRISVNGTVQGLDANNRPVNKLINARAYWDSIQAGLATYVGANGQALNMSVNEDVNQGSIQYSLAFTNLSGNYYKNDYSASYSIGAQGTPQVTIQGQIEGYLPDTFFSDIAGTKHKFNNALSGWAIVSPNLKSLAFAYTQIFPSGHFYSDLPTAKSISFDKPNGTISYNYTFGFAGSGNNANTYTDEYQVSIDSPNSPVNPDNAGLLINASINGTIVGLPDSSFPEDLDLRYTNARAAWNNTVRYLLYTRANTEVALVGSGPALHSGFVTRSVSTNKYGGTISYSASFNNFKAPTNASVAAEDVKVEYKNGNDIFAVQVIPGLSSGPIIQKFNTRNENQISINVALTLYPSGGSWWSIGRHIPANYASGLITGYLPTGVRNVSWCVASDSESWDPKNGLYNKSITIVY